VTCLDAYEVVQRLFGVDEAVLQDEDQAPHHPPADEVDGHREGKEEEPPPEGEPQHSLQDRTVNPGDKSALVCCFTAFLADASRYRYGMCTLYEGTITVAASTMATNNQFQQDVYR